MNKKNLSAGVLQNTKTLDKENNLSYISVMDSEILSKNEKLLPLLPLYGAPLGLLYSDQLPLYAKKIEDQPYLDILQLTRRIMFTEGLYVRKKDLIKLNRYKNSKGSYRNDFDKNQFFEWIIIIENNTMLCEMDHPFMGKGVFVPPRKKLPRGTFIPSSGIIKFNPSKKELATKVQCSALQDLNTAEKRIVGLIDPQKIGGIMNFINHAPDKEEINYFTFASSSIKENIAISNLKSKIKFYNGYAIMGLEVMEDLDGGKFGKQLLWSYAHYCEYSLLSNKKRILLFDNREQYSGLTIDTNLYQLSEVAIFIDTGKLNLQEVACLTKWEIMETPSESKMIISIEYISHHIKQTCKDYSISYQLLQHQLRKNPNLNQIIIPLYLLIQAAAEDKSQ